MNLTEGRILHDAFVLDAKAGAVCVCANASEVAGNVTIGGDHTNGVTINFTGDKVLYTIDGSDPRCSGTAVEANANVNSSTIPEGAVVKAICVNGNKAVNYGIMAEATVS